MATIIEEIPIDISEEAQPEEVDPVTDEAPVEEEPTAPAPKKRGRPIGAKNRPKPKIVAAPKAAKPKRKAPPPPPSEDEEESEEETPPTPIPMRRRARVPPPQEEYEEEPPMDPRLVAAEMLQMLSQRHAGRTQAKKAKYASWFPNNAVY
jgi:hypothetical protein